MSKRQKTRANLGLLHDLAGLMRAITRNGHLNYSYKYSHLTAMRRATSQSRSKLYYAAGVAIKIVKSEINSAIGKLCRNILPPLMQNSQAGSDTVPGRIVCGLSPECAFWRGKPASSPLPCSSPCVQLFPASRGFQYTS